MPDLSRQCEPDCGCGCGLSNCSCRLFRIPPEWLGQKPSPPPPAPWDPARPTLWQRIREKWRQL